MKINVVRNVLDVSEKAAEENRRRMTAAGVLSVNLLGDWLRDALNPKLR